jgi:hypothetical protein
VTPFGHLAISLLLARPFDADRRALALCLFGGVAPDLIDKPLFALELVPVAHTVGHSVLLVGALAAVAARHRALGPLALGWAGHVAADLVVAYPKFLVNYAWPLLESRPTPDDPFLAYWVEYALGPLGALELVLVAAALATAYGRGLPRLLVRGPEDREPDR